MSSIHPPSIALHDESYNNILQLLVTLLQHGKGKVDFSNFIGNMKGTPPAFGSHYAHCITFGETSLAETRFTLESEVTAREKSVDLKAEATADVEGLSGKIRARDKG